MAQALVSAIMLFAMLILSMFETMQKAIPLAVSYGTVFRDPIFLKIGVLSGFLKSSGSRVFDNAVNAHFLAKRDACVWLDLAIFRQLHMGLHINLVIRIIRPYPFFQIG